MVAPLSPAQTAGQAAPPHGVVLQPAEEMIKGEFSGDL